MKELILQIDYASPEYDEALRLRYVVLREPLKLEYEVEQIEEEFEQFHFGYFLAPEKLVGVLTLQPQDEEVIKMRQVAVDESKQKAGIGTKLVAHSEEWAKKNGYKIMVLHARDIAAPFYERLGYHIDGKPFKEVGIKHYAMRKVL